VATYKASVTYEFPEAAPETWRGAIVAGRPSTAASRAIEAARRVFPRRRPSSVVVLLESPHVDGEAT